MYECRCRLSASLDAETRGRGSGSIAATVVKSYYRLAWKDVQIGSSGKIYTFICIARCVSDANSSNDYKQEFFNIVFHGDGCLHRAVCNLTSFRPFFKRTNNFLCCCNKYFLLFSSICSQTDTDSLVLLFGIISQVSQSAEIYESSPAGGAVRSQWHRVVDRGVAASGEIKSYSAVS